MAQGGGAADGDRRRGNTILPYLSAPDSFKRLLGRAPTCIRRESLQHLVSPIGVGVIENRDRNASRYDAYGMFALNDCGDILAFERDPKRMSLIESRKGGERLHRSFPASA